MDELNGRMMACEILVTGLIARVANNSPDPLRFLTDFRDEIKAVVQGRQHRGDGKHRAGTAGRAADRRRVVFADEAAEQRIDPAWNPRKPLFYSYFLQQFRTLQR